MRYIYLIKDPETLRIVYVGETKDLKSRINQHLSNKGSNEMKNDFISNLKDKGLTAIFEIIDFANTKREALTKENQYINKYLKEGFELFNKRNNKILKQYDLEGNLIAEYEDMSMAQRATGIRPRLDRYSAGGFYWTYREFDINKIKQKEQSLKVRCKPVQQFDLNGNFIAEFEGVRIANKQTGIHHKSISQVAAGSIIRKTAGGFKWKYK
jgi:predicted GIY-YIG superfamily endonuclease